MVASRHRLTVPAWIDVGASTHTGRLRATNEDDYLLWSGGGGEPVFVAALADGMGGLVGGGEASRLATRALVGEFLARAAADSATDAADWLRQQELALRCGYDRAGEAVADRAARSPRLREMGTTLTAVVVGCTGGAVVGHIGDSRCMHIHEGQGVWLTTDHAVEGHARHLLTRCIGVGNDGPVDADFARIELARGDRVVLVSDGVWNGLSASEIVALVGSSGNSVEASERLVERAVRASGADNATAIVLAWQEGQDGEHTVELLRDEPWLQQAIPCPDHRLTSPWWPWIAWGLALVLAGAAFAQAYFGVDLESWWTGLLSGG